MFLLYLYVVALIF